MWIVLRKKSKRFLFTFFLLGSTVQHSWSMVLFWFIALQLQQSREQTQTNSKKKVENWEKGRKRFDWLVMVLYAVLCKNSSDCWVFVDYFLCTQKMHAVGSLSCSVLQFRVHLVLQQRKNESIAGIGGKMREATCWVCLQYFSINFYRLAIKYSN